MVNFQKRLERKIQNNPELVDGLNKAIQRRIDSGVFIYLSDLKKMRPDVDWESYKMVFSPINYTIKSSSKNNKIRPVVNASFKPNPHKPSLNQAKYKGSSGNKNIADILRWIRQHKLLTSTDLDDFYQTLSLSPDMAMINMMFHKREGYGSPGEFEPLVSTKANFGHTDSQFLCNKIKHNTCERFVRPISEDAADQSKWSLTDDIYLGAENFETLDILKNALEEGLKRGKFKLKPFVTSFDPVEEGQKIGQGVLGLTWIPSRDTLKIPININAGAKRRGDRGEELSIKNEEDISRILNKTKLTKRILLRLSSQLFDPNLIFCQIKAHMSLLFRKALRSSNKKINWEDELDPSLIPDVKQVVKMLLEVENIEYPRCVVEGMKEGTSIDICASADGSLELSCARIFIRYKTKEDKINCNYLCGAVKLSTGGPSTAPKCEVEAGLMALKLIDQVVKQFTYLKIDSIYLVSDSEIFLGGVSSDTVKQRLFYSTRNKISRELIKIHNVKLKHCNSADSDSDVGTKIGSENLALRESYWKSLNFMKPKGLWPFRDYEFKSEHVSSIVNEKLSSTYTNMFRIETRFTNRIDNGFLETIIRKYNSFNKIKKLLASLLHWKSKSLEESLTKAQQILLDSFPVDPSIAEGVRRQYDVVKMDEGLYHVLPRKMKIGKEIYQDTLRLVDGDCPIGPKLIQDFHTCVSGVGNEIAKMMKNGYYITKHRKLFGKLQKSCPRCRILRKRGQEQYMGASVQPEIARKYGPFQAVFLDCCGYFWATLSRNKRKKIWILIITCIFTRFSLFLCLDSMEANSILMALRTGLLQVGCQSPYLVFSDEGSNLRALMHLSAEENGKNDDVDDKRLISELKRVLHHSGIILKTSVPHSSWRNSLAEVVVRELKKALKRSNLFAKSHTLPQWQYLLQDVQYQVNSRPLNLNFQGDEMCILSPNTTIFGSQRFQYENSIDLNNLSGRSAKLFENQMKLDKDLDRFRELWWYSYFHSVAKQLKWKNSTKPLSKGDLVMVLDRKASQKTSLGLIEEVLSDKSYRIKYVKKLIKVNPETFEVQKTAKHGIISRPAQQICLISTAEENNQVNLEPILNINPEDPVYPPLNDDTQQDSETLNHSHLITENDSEVLEDTAAFEGENTNHDPFFLNENGSNIQKSTSRQKQQEEADNTMDNVQNVETPKLKSRTRHKPGYYRKMLNMKT